MCQVLSAPLDSGAHISSRIQGVRYDSQTILGKLSFVEYVPHSGNVKAECHVYRDQLLPNHYTPIVLLFATEDISPHTHFRIAAGKGTQVEQRNEFLRDAQLQSEESEDDKSETSAKPAADDVEYVYKFEMLACLL